MADKTVAFRPFAGQSFSITGSEADAGVVGELERSGGLYQRDLAGLLRRRLASDAVVVDGGAHIGVLTVLMARLCPAGHVYAFEPAPQNVDHLTANLAANGAGNVTVEPAALYGEDGELALDFNAANPGGSHVGAGTVRVRSVRLDTWVGHRRLSRLDLVKLDVEGAELAVLDGATETLRRLRPMTVVECNPVALPRFAGRSYRELLRRLRSLFPVVGLIGPGGAVVPLAGERHLELALNHRGVVDLVGLPEQHGDGLARGRGVVDAVRLLAAHNRWRRPVTNFVVDPGRIELRPAAARLDGVAGETVRVAVDVRNRSHSWLSSQFPYEPVHLSYRWVDADGQLAVSEGHRTPFPEPLGPGRDVRLDAAVQFPAGAGKYELVLTLVQEHFAWLDEIDDRCTGRVAATVEAAGARAPG